MPRNSKTPNVHDTDCVDRISNLPIEIIRQIHSRLPWKDAARTSVLSQIWRSFWDSRPKIYLDETDFGTKFFKYSDRDKEKRDLFLTYLQKSLDRREKSEYDSAVDSLLLTMIVENSSAEFLVKKWIDFALKNKVKTLLLSLKKTYHNGFDLRDVEIKTATLVTLDIEYCEISNCSFMLPNLRSLFLHHVCIADDDFGDLIGGCPQIEKLSIVNRRKLGTIVVSNPTLKLFVINVTGFGGKILIESKNLESLTLYSFSKGTCKVEITSTATVRNLTLLDFDDQDRRLMNYINIFPLLEKLVIYQYVCSNLKVSHQHLTSFVLEAYMEIEEVILDAPKLKSFEYRGGLTLFPGIETSHELEFVHLHLKPRRLNNRWYIWLRNMLESFAHSKHVRLTCLDEQAIRFPDELTEILAPTINDLKNLELRVRSSTAASQQILDGFVRILPGLKTLSFTSSSISELIEFPQ
ncbi:putative F-box/FBD/LRR-repeat protein At3g49030 [Lycium ferocissimum]|uniref:putative F-box/FBD/LRR-repeat protein At3g49030 n=1 Tax=Lycium ferocissimum TaxID=112874 RepID=UPI002815CC06|nr:putative F-box/FBD/LRR-repeat protein At3g49030 [Lycium ferocissimum]